MILLTSPSKNEILTTINAFLKQGTKISLSVAYPTEKDKMELGEITKCSESNITTELKDGCIITPTIVKLVSEMNDYHYHDSNAPKLIRLVPKNHIFLLTVID